MPENLPEVQPGDLITAEYMNRLRACLADLKERVENLEAGAPGQRLEIASLSGGNRPGQVLHVEGKNFETPPVKNDVTIGGMKVSDFEQSSTAERLSFRIPVLPQLPRSVEVVVSNRFGSDSAAWFVQPHIVEEPKPQGRLLIATGIAEGRSIAPGANLEFQYELTLQGTRALAYELNAVFRTVRGASARAWRDATKLTDATGNAVDEIELKPGEAFSVTVSTRVPANAQEALFALRASSVNSPRDAALTRTSSVVPLAIGQDIAPSDPRIAFGPPTVKNGRLEPSEDGLDTLRIDSLRGAQIRVPVLSAKKAEVVFDASGFPEQSLQVQVVPVSAVVAPEAEQIVTLNLKSGRTVTGLLIPSRSLDKTALLQLQVSTPRLRDSQALQAAYRMLIAGH